MARMKLCRITPENALGRLPTAAIVLSVDILSDRYRDPFDLSLSLTLSFCNSRMLSCPDAPRP